MFWIDCVYKLRLAKGFNGVAFVAFTSLAWQRYPVLYTKPGDRNSNDSHTTNCLIRFISTLRVMIFLLIRLIRMLLRGGKDQQGRPPRRNRWQTEPAYQDTYNNNTYGQNAQYPQHPPYSNNMGGDYQHQVRQQNRRNFEAEAYGSQGQGSYVDGPPSYMEAAKR